MITIDTASLDRARHALGEIPGAVERAAARALNRAATAGRQAAVVAICNRYAAKSTDVRRMITISTATPEKLDVRITARSKPLSLGYFPHTPRRPGTGGRGKPTLRTEIRRGHQVPFKGAFVARVNSGLRIMVRTGGKTATGKTAMRSVPSLPLAIMLGAPTVERDVEERATAVFDSRLEHEIDRALGGNQ